MKWFMILLLLYNCNSIVKTVDSVCTYQDYIKKYFQNEVVQKENEQNSNIYIIYDVNPPEGFNLRRDVYIRMAVFLRHLMVRDEFKEFKLVLPPFSKLYHWQSRDIEQNFLTWKQFFDLESLSQFTSVVDYDDFLKELNLRFDDPLVIDQIFQLQHFKEMFENGVFFDKFKIETCDKNNHNLKRVHKTWNCVEKSFLCLKFQGTTKLLNKVVKYALKTIKTRPAIIMFLNTEIVLHEQWGSLSFWMARRSMRFNKDLVALASDFRLINFNSTNELDLVQRPQNWKDEKYYRNAKGGPYMCAHLRRGDFLYGRESLLPTLKSAASQIKAKLSELNLTKIFISSDCTDEDFLELKSYLPSVEVYRFSPKSIEIRKKIKDGGVAIIDQIICSHAAYFLGTYESTFTYRIQEEREILGFQKTLTFNTFCKNEDLSNCQKNAVWPIVY